jgi:uncharacterized cupredoxin-like copper-binding protein
MTHQHDSGPSFVARFGPRSLAALSAALLLAAAACGGDSDDGGGLSADATTAGSSGDGRTIDVVMTDNKFSPQQIEVAPGETVTFAFRNDGAVTHDAVVGDDAAQAEHEEEMRAAESEGSGMDGMGHGDEADGDVAAITVEAGDTGELTHTFEAGDALLIGCHEPGHYDAGMKIDVAVSDA